MLSLNKPFNFLSHYSRVSLYRAIGGAPLLGVRGVCIIAHGSSDALAIKNSIRVAVDAVEAGMVEKTADLLAAEKGGAG